jgi:hypothetical protein
MPRRVKGPDGTIHDFPDDATDSEISAALEAIPSANAKQAPRARTWTDTAVDLLPAAGGMAGGLIGTALGTLPGAVGGATVGGALGESARQGINTLRGVNAPKSFGEAAGNVVEEGALQGGTELIGGGIAAGMRPIARSLMQSSLKPSVTMSAEALKRNPTAALPVVQTMLDEGINVSPSGLRKLNRLISSTNEEIKDAVSGIDASINPYGVVRRLAPVMEAEKLALGNEGQQAVAKVGREFYERHGKEFIPIQKAQDIKIKGYQDLTDAAYGQITGAEKTAKKVLLRGLKEDIASEAELAGRPISELNAREGKLLDLRGPLARRVAQTGNMNPQGLAGLAVQRPLTWLTMMADRSPAFKSALARGLYSSAGKAAGVNPNVIRAAVAAVASSEDEEGQ